MKLTWTALEKRASFPGFLSFRRSNFCKDYRDKTEVPDPLVVEDPISDKLNNRRK